MLTSEFEKLTDVEKLAQAIDEFQNEGDDEWSLDIDEISHFIYWMQHQARYKNIYKTLTQTKETI